MSHLGRPENNSRDESLSLLPVAKELSRLLNMEVKFSNSCISDESIDISNKLNSKEIHLLENLRFHSGERVMMIVFQSYFLNMLIYMSMMLLVHHIGHMPPMLGLYSLWKNHL